MNIVELVLLSTVVWGVFLLVSIPFLGVPRNLLGSWATVAGLCAMVIGVVIPSVQYVLGIKPPKR